MNITVDRLAKYGFLIQGFSSEPVPVRVIKLPVKAGILPRQVTVQLDFLMVKIPVAYNAILRQPALCALNVVSIKYLLMKFPTKNGIGQIKGNQAMARQCYNTKVQAEAQSDPFSMELDTRNFLSRDQFSRFQMTSHPICENGHPSG